MGSAETAAVATLKCGHPIVPRETLTAYKLFQKMACDGIGLV